MRVASPSAIPAQKLRSARVAILLIASFFVPLAVAQGGYLEPPYAVPGLPELEARVLVEHDTPAPAVDGATASPHGGRWFASSGPDFGRDPPWTTRVEVRGRDGLSWRVRLVDHANADVRAVWVTEQLLLVTVWWGRAVSSELLFDAGTGERVHATTYAWYGAGAGAVK